MAIVEIINKKANVKTKPSLKRIINYVTQASKTNNDLITGRDCLSKSVLEEMQYTKDYYNKKDGRQYLYL